MPPAPQDADAHNRAVFDAPETVADYSKLQGLFPAEERAFALVAAGRVLDLGVGTGRTVPAVRAIATRYVGIDVAPAMVDACTRAFPDADVRVGDAADLSQFGDASFDTVVFSFNGIDYLHPSEKRAACLREIHRVLVPGGTFVLSAHNARAIVRWLATARGPWPRRLAASLVASARLVRRALTSRAFVRGAGYRRDVARDLVTHVATPGRLRRELETFGFEVRATFPGGPQPGRGWVLSTPWYQYVCRRLP